MRRPLLLLAAFVPALLAVGPCTAVKAVTQAALSAESHMVMPKGVEPTPERIAQLRVPEGLGIRIYADDLEGARMLAVTPDGTVLVTRPKHGDVVALRDDDGDGRAEARRTVAAGLEGVHGLALHQGQVFLATPTQVWRAGLGPRGELQNRQLLIDGLPEGGQHPHRTLGVGPDDRLYVSVGSSCNDCDEKVPAHAAMLRFALDGTGRQLFAKGLRNTIGFDWHPETRELWGMDHGSDHRGDDLPPEELNHIVEHGDYGWPLTYADQRPDPIKTPKDERRAERERTVPMVLGYQAHSAPIQLTFYRSGKLKQLSRGDALVVFRGSWNRKPPAGYKLARLKFEAGRPVGFEDLVSGFLAPDGATQFARLAGVAELPDGSILLGDEANGVVYRLAEKRPPGGE